MANKQSAKNLPGPGPGRPKGSQNKTTALLKDAILKAAEAAGKKLEGGEEDGLTAYLTTQATNNPGPFLSLLGKVLPMQLDHGGEVGLKVEIVRFGDPSPGE